MIWVLTFFLSLYTLFIMMSIIGWNRTTAPDKNGHKTSESIAVVIPFRNEEKHLELTIQSVLNQKFSGEFEIILVNDHSEDSSSYIAESYANKHSQIKFYQLDQDTGKKQALDLGIQNTNSPIILQCDADCSHSSSWLNTMHNNFTSDCKLLLGPVQIAESTSGWNWVNVLEMMFLQSITASTLHFGKPTMANGANLMYLKKGYFDYKKSGTGSKSSSGDDQHLLNYLAEKDVESIKYCKDKNAIATTFFPYEWKEMVQQRSRWAKKNFSSKGQDALVGLFFLSVQFITPVLLLLSPASPTFVTHAALFFIVKTSLEFMAIRQSNQFFQTSSLKHTLSFAIIYPFFLLHILINSRKNNTWKGRAI